MSDSRRLHPDPSSRTASFPASRTPASELLPNDPSWVFAITTADARQSAIPLREKGGMKIAPSKKSINS